MDPALLYIIVATLTGGVLSVVLAGAVSLTVLSRWVGPMVSFAVGALLAVAFLDVLPEALERSANTEALLAALLAGLLLFFVLQKAALWRHSHGDAGGDHGEAHDPVHQGYGHGRGTGVMILVGDGFHNFVDGILLAAAFSVNQQLGIATTMAVIVHEIPQEIGDFMVLLASGFDRREALMWNLVSSLASVVGGVLGYLLLDHMQGAVPYVLALAASSFIYVAMADLIPELQRRGDSAAAVTQISLIAAGIAVIAVVHQLLHR